MSIQFAGSGYVFTTTGTLETHTCYRCGIPFALPETLIDWARAHSDVTFYCPLGHAAHFPGKTEAQKLKEARDALARERARHEQTAASLRGQKAAATRARHERDRLKHRAAHGVCPCCKRTFKQLASHMKNKHPEYLGAPESEQGE